jgi:hypothetical protein
LHATKDTVKISWNTSLLIVDLGHINQQLSWYSPTADFDMYKIVQYAKPPHGAYNTFTSSVSEPGSPCRRLTATRPTRRHGPHTLFGVTSQTVSVLVVVSALQYYVYTYEGCNNLLWLLLASTWLPKANRNLGNLTNAKLAC